MEQATEKILPWKSSPSNQRQTVDAKKNYYSCPRDYIMDTHPPIFFANLELVSPLIIFL